MLISHRGVHQTYKREGLSNETCTAIRINKSKHTFLENTIESIEEAFRNHADMVEIDIHPTTEKDGLDKLAVFHDYTADCRTEARCENGCSCNEANQCETNKQSLRFLQKLDIGFGYTYDSGESFPFRGKFSKKMPEFLDILKLLKTYKEKRILINVKGNILRTTKAFIRIVQSYPLSLRQRLYYPYKYGLADELKSLGIEKQIDQKAKRCILKYLKTGWYGHFPKECHNKRIFIPINESLERVIGKFGRSIKLTSIIWGWPKRFIRLAHENGTEVYASQVDTVKLYDSMVKLPLDGIMTNKIEIIGPYSKMK